MLDRNATRKKEYNVTMCKQNEEFLNVSGDIYSNHWDLEGYKSGQVNLSDCFLSYVLYVFLSFLKSQVATDDPLQCKLNSNADTRRWIKRQNK